ncbi:glycosyl transferase [Moorena producens PAL-8-15-08-1]|uniref:Glycosyl transferase n=1 Tax=Moorena producens PAL-8-15-08-1 TaxID=1458985 RepID=A0A1D8TNX7_9CYAN|nr:glycosyltransferase [Moorena producens]AOW99360.1 glycosyl transferase [Moorena producens PAL-8-15-08-1]
MKITLVCHDIPYPPIHGARLDMWRRIKAFSNLGIDIQVICWCSHTPKPEEVLEIRKYAKQVFLIKFPRTLGSFIRRIIDLLKYPLEVTSRIVRGKELKLLLSDVAAFNPDVIFLDGIHGGEVASQLSQHLNRLLVIRSHNIEHLYYKRKLASAKGLNKLKRYLSLSNLEKYEINLLKKSTLFYDISLDDLNFWRSQGLNNGRYLPPLIEFPEENREAISRNKLSPNPVYDIVFLGNLFSDNNVAGIIWFITQVMPIIRLELPTFTILIAGSNPVQHVRQLCEETAEVDLKINPVSSTEVYKSGRVLINPVSAGSGVSIKSLEMLVSGRPIVSTPQGIAGLPEEVHHYFEIAVDKSSFAEAIIRFLSDPFRDNVNPGVLEELFGYKAIAGVISELDSIVSLSKSNQLAGSKS